MIYHNYREYKLLDSQIPVCKGLDKDIKTHYLIVGGGVAGLHMALELLKHTKGSDIVLVEKTICGGGMSGKSGGFLTPDSELGLRQLVNRYGKELAKKVWDFGSNGQASIVNNIKKHHFRCDLRDEESLLLGLGKSGAKACKLEHEDRRKYGYDSQLIADKKELQQYNTGNCYTAAAKYKDCFGICAYQYCQELKQYLTAQGVRVFEFTEIDDLKEHEAISNCGTIHFQHCFLSPGKVSSKLSEEKAKLLFGVTNFITVSEPLLEAQIRAIMPKDNYMCRDTKLVFSYYRIIEGNRIILGGGNLVSSFLPRDIQYEGAIGGAIDRFKKEFPTLKGVRFSDYRSGRIQVTKDLMPIIDTCEHHTNHVWVLGCAGLPRAAACGEFAVQRHFGVCDPMLTEIFSQKRKRLIDRTPANNILKSIIFGMSNARSMFGQKGY